MLFRSELKHFTLTLRPHRQKDVITKQQRDLLTELKNNKEVTIRKAEKSGHVVIMSTTEYQQKIDNILSDTTKFIKIKKDTTEQLKTKVNGLIETLHMTIEPSQSIYKQIGHFRPAYIYGNPKIHKNTENPELRPIISQMTTPTRMYEYNYESYLPMCHENTCWPPPMNF